VLLKSRFETSISSIEEFFNIPFILYEKSLGNFQPLNDKYLTELSLNVESESKESEIENLNQSRDTHDKLLHQLNIYEIDFILGLEIFETSISSKAFML
jgi:hypothetical protein